MLKREWFKGKRITVFGIGLNRGALATIRFLAESGVREIIATDIRTKEELAPTLQELAKYKNITYVLGQHRPEDFTHVDMVIKNPVIPWTNEYVKAALGQRIPVEMDAGLFVSLVKNPMIGVTGTKGKTTTAALIAHILESAGQSVVQAGINQIGFLDALERLDDRSVVVAELSSWRLSSLGLHEYSPPIAVVTNIYPDHLNYYKKMEAYVADKEAIFRFQKEDGVLILNWDNEWTQQFAMRASGRVVWFSESGGFDGEGVFVRNGSVWERTVAGEQELFPWPKTTLMGRHNRSNILAALAATRLSERESTVLLEGLRSFKGVPHRLELVGEREGVTFYNDTAATMPEAAIAGIRAFDTPVVLIAGGTDKAFDYTELARIFVSEPKSVILLRGTATDKLLPLMEKEAALLGKTESVFPVVASMEDALRIAVDEARSGDVVLLSPGAASFGLFQNEFDRGDQFRKGVERLIGTE
jgi:UDP-N-acetylmuramoylalanine--D-glutamate ligase